MPHPSRGAREHLKQALQRSLNGVPVSLRILKRFIRCGQCRFIFRRQPTSRPHGVYVGHLNEIAGRQINAVLLGKVAHGVRLAHRRSCIDYAIRWRGWRTCAIINQPRGIGATHEVRQLG